MSREGEHLIENRTSFGRSSQQGVRLRQLAKGAGRAVGEPDRLVHLRKWARPARADAHSNTRDARSSSDEVAYERASARSLSAHQRMTMTDQSAPDAPATTPTLTARERASLKARAHALAPLVRVGHAGLTDASIGEIARALDAHELIKVRIAEGARDEREVMSQDISARTGAALVQRVGRVLVLWRPRPDHPSAKT